MADEKKKQHGNMKNPEQFQTNNESLLDKDERERNVDAIPLEDLKQDLQDEKDKKGTKNSSSSEKKYKK